MDAMPHTVRVAALQFATGTDVEANLQTCLRMIDQAAQQQPDLMVLPEFCNHSSWYRDQQHCYEVAVDLDGDFLRQIAERAARHRCIIMINCTVRRQSPSVTGTNILFDRDGSRLAVSDKQVLMGNENNFLSRANLPDHQPAFRTGRHVFLHGWRNL
jgi:predicted amidohydrolase